MIDFLRYDKLTFTELGSSVIFTQWTGIQYLLHLLVCFIFPGSIVGELFELFWQPMGLKL